MYRWFISTMLLAFSLSVSALEGNTLIVEAPMGSIWSKYTSSADANILRLIELLERSDVGRALVKKAASKASSTGLTMTDLIRPGEGSLTDTTLIRKFHPDSPENVMFETRSKVYINRHLPWREALLDLAHELTHYVYRENFNPYTLNFSMPDFIRSTIEGQGGEAHAFVTECQVMRELFTSEFAHDSNCGMINMGSGEMSRTKASELFYHLGSFYPQMKKIVESRGIASDFPHLNSDKIKFVSSAYGLPYPLAAMEEYQTVLSKVCENDRRRLAYMKSPGRSPASAEKFRMSVESRCPTISQN